ncbi:MAG: HEAT repeat domain-containing protein [Phycisphaerae bacterium]|nr:HEAT repeat domain-containing protein [Phycisphaerae bacterium]
MLTAALFVPPLARAADVPPAAVQTAREYLRAALGDDARLGVVLLGLRSTRDKELLPLYTALLRSSDRRTRLTTTAMIGELDDEALIEPLRERLKSDPAMAVRSEALVHLLRRDALTAAQLRDALNIDDDGVRMLAARALVQRNKADAAVKTLQSLLDSRDPQILAQARMSLFGLGVDTPKHRDELKKILLDPKTTDELLLLLLGQIRREKIKTAAEVAQYLTRPDYSRQVRVQAYMALADVAPDASKRLADAVAAENESDLFRINLIRILAEQPDMKYYLDDLVQRSDIAGAVARFEQARPAGGQAAAKTLQTLLIDMGHPVLLEYALNRMRGDVEKDKALAEFYVEPMLATLRQADLSEDRMSAQHDRMAMAVEWLANLGSPAAMAGLKKILDGPDGALRKVTAGALYRSTNPAVCDMVLPLLSSPYADYRIYAALTLARHSRAEAVPALLDIQAHADTHRPDVLTLSSWYLLKFAGQAAPAADALAKTVR